VKTFESFCCLWAPLILIGLTVFFTTLIGEKTTCPSVVITWDGVWQAIIFGVWIPMAAAFFAGRASKPGPQNES
jgi:hypothetical protein